MYVGTLQKLLKCSLAWSLFYSYAVYANMSPVLGLGLGGTNTINLTSKTTFPITSPVVDEFYTYTPSSQALTQGLIEAFVGVEHPINPLWLTQLGFAYTQTAMLKPSGNLLQGADISSADTYHYQYNVNLRQIMMQGKLMTRRHDKFYPYLLAGLGVGVNTASNFSTTAPLNLTFTRSYTDNTQTSFAFRLGLGVDVQVLSNVRLGLAYRITDEGNISLGNAKINTTPVSGTLSQSAVFANEFLVHLTYIPLTDKF